MGRIIHVMSPNIDHYLTRRIFFCKKERRRNSPNLVCDQDRAEYITGKLEKIFTARVFLGNSRKGLGEGREYQSRSHLLETVHQYTKIS